MLGVGTGEALNEIATGFHGAGEQSWPEFKERFARLRESVELMRALWAGERVSFDGEYYSTHEASIYDRPEGGIPVYIAAGGPVVAKYVGRAGDGFICTSGKGEELYVDQLLPAVEEGAEAAGRDSSTIDRMIEIKLSYDTDADTALENTRFWSPLALSKEQKHDITDPVEMEKAADALPIETIASRWIVGNDPDEVAAQDRAPTSTGASTTSSSTARARTSAASSSSSSATSRPGSEPGSRMARRWSVVVPVKGGAESKSRLRVDDGLREALALSFAMDTIAAALAVREVAEVIVVGPASLETAVRGLGARRADEPTGDGAGPSRLDSAILEGLRRVRDPRHATAVLLGDLPRLQPAELATALAAVRTPRGLVPDASGTGTVLTTALAGVRHIPRFGDGSAARHRAVGYVPIPLLGPRSMHLGLRGDVDTIADLGSTTDRALGRATRAALR